MGRLDPAAIAEVCADAWPDVRDAEELHDALLSLVALPVGNERRTFGPGAGCRSEIAGIGCGMGARISSSFRWSRRAGVARVGDVTYLGGGRAG